VRTESLTRKDQEAEVPGPVSALPAVVVVAVAAAAVVAAAAAAAAAVR
jgi:hypothetical protein